MARPVTTGTTPPAERKRASRARAAERGDPQPWRPDLAPATREKAELVAAVHGISAAEAVDLMVAEAAGPRGGTKLYTDPDLIRRVTDLAKTEPSHRAIARMAGISALTVRKILEPGYAEAKRLSGQAVDRARDPKRRRDPAYAAYYAAYNSSDKHRARARGTMARRREAERAETPDPAVPPPDAP